MNPTDTDINSLTTMANSEPDYCRTLSNLGIIYEERSQYLHVGNVTTSCGWIIHISVVRSQLEALLATIIPILSNLQVPYKIPNSFETARYIMDGHWGIEKIGKLVTIYPQTEIIATKTYNALKSATEGYYGPKILTDAYLGGCIYCRYGAHKNNTKINENEIKTYYINSEGEEVEDEITVPFNMPQKIPWPFEEYQLYTPCPITKKDKTKLLKTLKLNPRGNVYEGIYLKNGWIPRISIIKEGIKFMQSDKFGKDILDRLEFQFRLQTHLKTIIKVPKPYNLIKKDDAWFFVMQKIHGKTLEQEIAIINHEMKSLFSLPKQRRETLLKLLLNLIEIIEKIHKQGIIHRDITPANFIIDKKNRLVSIDMELAYVSNPNKTTPPFGIGTIGFMSPEQSNSSPPTIKEDIYAIGAITIYTLLGIFPTTITGMDKCTLSNTLFHLCMDEDLTRIIVQSLDEQPSKRPILTEIKTLFNYLIKTYGTRLGGNQVKCNKYDWANTIDHALNGLASAPLIMSEGIWTSLHSSKTHPSIDKNEHVIDCRLNNGISGILYLINIAAKKGYSTDYLKETYRRNFVYVANEFLNNKFSAIGLHKGTSGLALAISTGIDSNLLKNNEQNKSLLLKCINVKTENPTIGNGLSGVGLFLLQILEKYPDINIKNTLDNINETIYWKFYNQSKNENRFYKLLSDEEFFGLINGETGTVYYILEYYSRTNCKKLIGSLNYFLFELDSKVKRILATINKEGIRQYFGSGGERASSLLNTMLLTLKCFETLKQPKYRQYFEKIADNFPEHIVSDNLTVYSGITGLGEIYLKAFKVLGDIKWKNRAEWIINTIHLFAKQNQTGGKYWTGNNRLQTTAGLLTGNSGIIHFMINFVSDGDLGYPIIG